MVIAPQGFRDEELFVPKEMLEHAGHSVKIASLTRSRATGSRGASVQPDMAIYEANADFFDSIIVVGGPGCPVLAENEDMARLIGRANSRKKVVGAICMGPLVLARAGVLNGKNATIFPDHGLIRAMKECGALYSLHHVVSDGNIITADGPDSAAVFAKTIVEMLGSL